MANLKAQQKKDAQAAARGGGGGLGPGAPGRGGSKSLEPVVPVFTFTPPVCRQMCFVIRTHFRIMGPSFLIDQLHGLAEGCTFAAHDFIDCYRRSKTAMRARPTF